MEVGVISIKYGKRKEYVKRRSGKVKYVIIGGDARYECRCKLLETMKMQML